MKVLVTGGAGFIGSHLADHLLADGVDVVVLDVLHPQIHPDGAPKHLDERVELVVGDVRNRELVSHLVRDVDAVAHLASHTGVGQSMYRVHDYVDVNVGGTAVLLEALSARPHPPALLVASSRAVYGEGAYRCATDGAVVPAGRAAADLAAGRWEPVCPGCGGPIEPVATTEATGLGPTSVYALSKSSQEQAAMIVGAAYGLPVTVLRFFNVYGPRQSLRNPYTGVITAFVTRVLGGAAPEVYEDGLATRDFVHVADVVAACTAVLHDPVGSSGLVANVGSGEAASLLDVAQLVSTALGGPPPVVVGKYRFGDIRHCLADLTMAAERLGYAPSVDLGSGIADVARWVAGQHWEDRAGEAEHELVSRGLAGSPAAPGRGASA